MLNSFFQLTAQQTTVRTEVLGGFTTFLTMAYITFVNPAILAEAGMDFGAVFVATCVAAAVGSLIMGLWANYPIALAPGMGLNAYFTYDVVLTQGHGWPVALGAVFVSGLLFVMLSVLPVREWIINSIPRTLKLAISAGIGLFLAVIALRNAGVVVSQPVTMLGLGELRAPGPLLALIGFVCILALYTRKVPGAVVIGILVTTALGVAFGVSAWKGFASLPPDPRPTLWQLDLAGALTLSLVPVVFSFLFIDLFDTAGTLVGVSHRAGLLDARGRLPRVGRALLADSTATVVGAALGTSTTTSYIESAAGVEAGGRTGLTAVVVAVLFVLCLFFAPLAQSVPSYATAPALLFVACLMARGLAEVDWEDATEYAPAVVTAMAMPLTSSIADGIGIGFIVYAALKLASGKARECPPAVGVIALLFAARFALL
jgi:AGZA family xanthine/uracil permease-like MFS transporter